MFFFKRKKPETKNNLPEKLKALKDVDYPAWVWDPEFRMIIWSNAKGMAFWNVQTRNELKELIFPETHAMVMSCHDNNKSIRSGKIIYNDIALITRPQLVEFRCKLEAQKLPDGRDGILLTIIPQDNPQSHHSIADNPTSDKLKLAENSLPHSSKPDFSFSKDAETAENALKSSTIKPQEITSHRQPKIDSDKQKSISLDDYIDKPATFSCTSNGVIVGADDISHALLSVRIGDRFVSLFEEKEIGQNILSMALNNQRYSTITKTNIAHHGVLPYVVQTSQFMHNNQLHFNAGLMLITEKAYEAFIQEQTIDSSASLNISQNQSTPDTNYTDEFLSATVIGNIASSDIAVFDVGSDGIIKLNNQMASRLTGYDEHALIGQNVIYLFGNDAQPVLTELVFNPTKEILNDLHDGVVCRFTDANGIERNCRLTVRANKTKTGYWFILSENAHSNYQAQPSQMHAHVAQPKQSSQQDAHDAKQPKSQTPIAAQFTSETKTSISTFSADNKIPSLVSAVSHEIRAPLNAISGYAEMIESEMFGALPDPRYKDFAKSIRGAGQYALSIVNELLDYSKLKAGGFVPDFQPTDIPTAISDAVATVYPMAHARNIEISQTILTGTPKISSDPRLLRQILINLLTNAIKYSHDNEQVIITAGSTKTGRIMFEVTDFGRGMTEQEIHDALVPFQRGHQANDIPGTGLGLSLSKELAELTHGRFMIDSIPGQKTRVRIIYESSSIV